MHRDNTISAQLLAEDENKGRFRIERFQLKQYMGLDAAAVEALNLVPQKGEGTTCPPPLLFLSHASSCFLSALCPNPSILSPSPSGSFFYLSPIYVPTIDLSSSLENTQITFILTHHL